MDKVWSNFSLSTAKPFSSVNSYDCHSKCCWEKKKFGKKMFLLDTYWISFFRPTAVWASLNMWARVHPRQMGYRVEISPLIINITSLLPHQGCSPLHSAGTEMGEGPGLLAGKGEIRASKSPRTIPPGSGSLGKSSTASNRSSLMPHGWKKLALTLSSFSSEICHLVSSRKKKKRQQPYCFYPFSHYASAASLAHSK